MQDYKSWGKGSATLMMASKQEVNNGGNLIELNLKEVTISKKIKPALFEGGLK